MFVMKKENVLAGLKAFRRLAKQDLLTSDKTSNPAYWKQLAQVRRTMYTDIMNVVENQGVKAACKFAQKQYATLPLPKSRDVVAIGKRQAIDMFFILLGMDERNRFLMAR